MIAYLRNGLELATSFIHMADLVKASRWEPYPLYHSYRVPHLPQEKRGWAPHAKRVWAPPPLYPVVDVVHGTSGTGDMASSR